MRTPRIPSPSPSALAALLACVLIAITPSLCAAELHLTDPLYGKINASGLEQPRLYVLVSDPAQADAFITWFNPQTETVEPALLTAFIDTGASGFAISQLHASGEHDQPDLGLEPDDYFGPFTEIGIGGEELGDVSRPFGIWVRNGAIGAAEEIFPSEFIPFGDFSLWVRREVGSTELVEIFGALYPSPVNLVGMPVIRQRRLFLDISPMYELNELGLPGNMLTSLLAPAAPEPVTHATVTLTLRDFIDETALPPGEIAPSHDANPLVPGITLHEGAGSATGEWLLDTGAGSSFASFALARACGLIPAHYADLAAFMADYTGPTTEIGGIGATQLVPILNVDRITLPTREGVTLVWENVDLLVVDVAGLDGIFGMNLLQSAATPDPDDPFAVFDFSPPSFNAVVIDTTDADAPVMRVATPRAVGTVFGWLGETFTAAERLQTTVGTLTADPDADGAANLLEYALGLDPRAPTAPAALPSATEVLVAGVRHLALTFSRPAGGRADVGYAVELSRDLVAWRRDAEALVHHATTPDGDRETVTVRTTAPLGPGEPVFLRLVVTLAP